MSLIVNKIAKFLLNRYSNFDILPHGPNLRCAIPRKMANFPRPAALVA